MTRYQWLVFCGAAWWGSTSSTGCQPRRPDLRPNRSVAPEALAEPENRARVTRIVGWMTPSTVGWGTGGILFAT
jgi:hypothetical protein